MASLPSPSSGSAQVSLNSLFDDFDLEPIKDLCFLHDDLEAISGIQELFENDNLGILKMTIILRKEQERSVHQLPLALLQASVPFKVRQPLIWLLRQLTHHVRGRLRPLLLSTLFTCLQGT